MVGTENILSFIQYEALLLKWQVTSPSYLDSPAQAESLLRRALDLYKQELEQTPPHGPMPGLRMPILNLC